MKTKYILIGVSLIALLIGVKEWHLASAIDSKSDDVTAETVIGSAEKIQNHKGDSVANVSNLTRPPKASISMPDAELIEDNAGIPMAALVSETSLNRHFFTEDGLVVSASLKTLFEVNGFSELVNRVAEIGSESGEAMTDEANLNQALLSRAEIHSVNAVCRGKVCLAEFASESLSDKQVKSLFGSETHNQFYGKVNDVDGTLYHRFLYLKTDDVSSLSIAL